jgi:hypothetical protein
VPPHGPCPSRFLPLSPAVRTPHACVWINRMDTMPLMAKMSISGWMQLQVRIPRPPPAAGYTYLKPGRPRNTSPALLLCRLPILGRLRSSSSFTDPIPSSLCFRISPLDPIRPPLSTEMLISIEFERCGWLAPMPAFSWWKNSVWTFGDRSCWGEFREEHREAWMWGDRGR